MAHGHHHKKSCRCGFCRKSHKHTKHSRRRHHRRGKRR
jgi:hypothetical protein